MPVAGNGAAPIAARKARSGWARVVRSLLGGAFPVGVLLLLAFGPSVAPGAPTTFDPANILQEPSLAFLFGTDEFGRDVFSRVLWGARPTLFLALACAGLGVLLGAPTGLAAGYFGGRIDEMLMRTMDVLMSFPALILAMLIVVMLGASTINVILAIGVVFWPRSARLIRSVTQDIARREFVDAARARGEPVVYILGREILPNIIGILIVDFTLRVAAAILLTASLSYLGIGVKPPTPAWGLMVKEGQQFLQIAPWLVIFPCLAIAVVSIGTVLTGDRLRRAIAIPDGRGR
ncbi:MAG: ABC transporter permease [Alphaproteobacteria bacterium]|nr:ABC transporter permease [Alphaproteobacteria bacterium]